MKLGIVYDKAQPQTASRPPCGSVCLLCDWTSPAVGCSGEVLLRGHLRDFHCRWMVSSEERIFKGRTTMSLDGPRWQDHKL